MKIETQNLKDLSNNSMKLEHLFVLKLKNIIFVKSIIQCFIQMEAVFIKIKCLINLKSFYGLSCKSLFLVNNPPVVWTRSTGDTGTILRPTESLHKRKSEFQATLSLTRVYLIQCLLIIQLCILTFLISVKLLNRF